MLLLTHSHTTSWRDKNVLSVNADYEIFCDKANLEQFYRCVNLFGIYIEDFYRQWLLSFRSGPFSRRSKHTKVLQVVYRKPYCSSIHGNSTKAAIQLVIPCVKRRPTDTLVQKLVAFIDKIWTPLFKIYYFNPIYFSIVFNVYLLCTVWHDNGKNYSDYLELFSTFIAVFFLNGLTQMTIYIDLQFNMKFYLFLQNAAIILGNLSTLITIPMEKRWNSLQSNIIRAFLFSGYLILNAVWLSLP